MECRLLNMIAHYSSKHDNVYQGFVRLCTDPQMRKFNYSYRIPTCADRRTFAREDDHFDWLHLCNECYFSNKRRWRKINAKKR